MPLTFEKRTKTIHASTSKPARAHTLGYHLVKSDRDGLWDIYAFTMREGCSQDSKSYLGTADTLAAAKRDASRYDAATQPFSLCRRVVQRYQAATPREYSALRAACTHHVKTSGAMLGLLGELLVFCESRFALTLSAHRASEMVAAS